MPHLRQKRRFPHRILTDGYGVRHVSDTLVKGWWGYVLVFDRINRIEGDGRRNAEGAEKGIP